VDAKEVERAPAKPRGLRQHVAHHSLSQSQRAAFFVVSARFVDPLSGELKYGVHGLRRLEGQGKGRAFGL